jgi:outer membrane immunogenic protein
LKKLLLSTVALVGLTAGSLAADLPARRVAPAPYAAIPVFTWTGFYVGVNAGYGWGDRNNNNNGLFGGGSALTVDTVGGVAPVTAAPGSAIPANGFFNNGNRRDGFVGGAQIGYNWQMTPGAGFVFGVEADIQWSDVGRGNRNGLFGGSNGLFAANPVLPYTTPGLGIVAVPAGGANVALFNVGGVGNRNRSADWFGTARVRLGYAVDRALFYVTGGLAFTDSNNNNNGFATGAFTTGAAVAAIPAFATATPGTVAAIAAVNPTAVGCCFTGRNGNNIGWALGGGVEYAWTNNITTKLEGLWVGFDRNKNNNFFGAGAGGVVGVSNTGAPVRGIANNGFFNRKNGDDVFIARVGLNYKFGS